MRLHSSFQEKHRTQGLENQPHVNEMNMRSTATLPYIQETKNDFGIGAFRYYQYQPSMTAAVIFVVLFALTTALHMVQIRETRSWFMIPFAIGGIRKFNKRVSSWEWRLRIACS